MSALVGALADIDRLILLGDVLELRHGPVRLALEAAVPAMRAIGTALGPDGEVVIVPGNHDHHLAEPWLERRAREAEPAALGLESAVEILPADVLGVLAGWLAPARVRAAYPGVFLRTDVYATHGHYGDRHTTVPILERLAAGAMRRVVGETDGGPRRAEDYEAELAPVYAWIHAVAQGGAAYLRESARDPSARAWRVLSASGSRRGLRRRALALGFTIVVAGVNRAGLGPVKPDLSGEHLRRAGLRAFAEVLDRLGVSVGYAIFGHIHRAGPLPGEDRPEWTAHGIEVINTGCWITDRAFIGSSPRTSPYRPGFAAILEDTGPPRLVNLLDGAQSSSPGMKQTP